jgi:hypothetical protein
MRDTFFTEAGEHTDPFTLQCVPGHDNIKRTMCYVHPQANAVHKVHVRSSDLGWNKLPAPSRSFGWKEQP